MRYSLICLSILGLFAIGCEKKQAAPATAPAPAPKVEAPAVPAARPEAPAARTDVPSAPATPAIPDTAKPAEAQPAAATTGPATADAQSKLDQVMQYIKDKKYDLAEKLLAELDAQKASLPTSIQDQISTAQTALKTAKAASGASDAAGGAKLPSFGK